MGPLDMREITPRPKWRFMARAMAGGICRAMMLFTDVSLKWMMS